MRRLQVLGQGCIRCNQLEENTRIAANELGIEYVLDKITDINVITGFGVLMVPALAVDGEVKSTGKVLSVEDIKKIIA
jgi:small redox-active disulfide protein 2